MKKILTIMLTTMLAIAVIVGTTMAAGLDQATAMGRLIIPGENNYSGILISNSGAYWSKNIALGELVIATSSKVYTSFYTQYASTASSTPSFPVKLSATVDNPSLANNINFSLNQYSSTGTLIYSYNGRLSDLTTASSSVNFNILRDTTYISIAYSRVNSSTSGNINYTLYLTQRYY